MPSIAGPIKINAIGSGGNFTVGDTLNISPKSTAKSYGGSGSFNTGDLLQTNNGLSSTNTMDSDLNDASNFANN
ncbi:spore germination protein PF [Scopulibacillus darangshiensis]|uniref:Spore germination protein PF n=1 Tax=Scopulibacillus darangshiensis TaxID=442528 RepID=A0A4R2PCD5_9BACL|nr:spore germination protein [Scopulibacillus darangshiensis]TCP31595.1 spore germination protein PF [Scopulibacillus darangshiensis]